MHKQLLLVNKDGKMEGQLHSVLPNEKIFDETWLQELLIRNPELLPIKDINENLNDIIPLGREVSVTSGPIDNLYITTEGTICLIETKLWRNPDAHRSVVAQVIDYAKALSGMSFEEFVQIVEKSQLFGEKAKFWNRISKYIKEIEQIEFQSKVQDALEHGRFLLLIVGDKIYPEVAMLVEAIQSAPNLEFKIGLIEIHMYKTDKDKIWPLIILPKVVGKTNEIMRSVVRIVYEEKKPKIEVESFEEESGQRLKTNEETFIHSMPKEFAEILKPVYEQWVDNGFVINWGSVGFSVRTSPKSKNNIDIYPNYISLMTDDMMKRRELPLAPYHEYKEAINKIPIARRMLSENRRYVYYKDTSLEEFKSLLEETDKLLFGFKQVENG